MKPADSKVITVSTHDLKRILVFCIRNKKTALIVSKPGVGKTEIVHQSASECKAGVYVDYSATKEPTDWTGFLFPDWANREAVYLPNRDMKRLCNAEEEIVWFLDEVGCASEANQKSIMHIVLTREVNGVPLSPKVSIIGATNERWHKAGVTGMMETFKARWDMIIHVEPDIDSWVRDYAIPQGLPPALIAHERFRPEWINMTEWSPSPDMVRDPSPRTISKVGRLMQLNPPTDLEYSIYSSCAGKAFATDLVGFLKMYRSLPDLDLIIANPEGEGVPNQLDVLYAVCTGLVSKATATNFSNIVKYANRLPNTHSVMLILDCLAKDRKLAETKAFVQWSAKHSNVMLPF